MESKHSFESAALRANLETTRADDTRIPSRHRRLLDAAVSQYGVHNRLRLYLEEYHHRYPNLEWIVSQLRTIMLQDFWFYSRHSDAPTLLGLLVGICDELLAADETIAADVSLALRRRVFQTLLECAGECVATDATRLQPAIDAAVDALEAAMQRDRMLSVVASSPIRSMAAKLLAIGRYRIRVTDMLRKALEDGVTYWQGVRYIERVLDDHESLLVSGRIALLDALGHATLEQYRRRLHQAETWEELQAVPDYHTIAERFRSAADHFTSPLERAYYLSAILPFPGLSHLKEHLLWDLNRVLRSVYETSDHAEIEIFLVELFHILALLRGEHMSTVLDCLQTLGVIIYASDDPVLIEQFTYALISFGFVFPEFQGDDSTRARVGRDHVKNIRVWLELVKANPKRSARLLSALIINLRLGGVYIQDNDLFQRDITALLNAGIRPVMFLVKQLAILFPVYFNEIGAEGELRDTSTVIDEIGGRRDRLIHFLRKQIHAESNNTHIDLTAAILRYWETGDRAALEPLLREDVVAWLSEERSCFEDVHGVVRTLCGELACRAEELPDHDMEELTDVAGRVSGLSDVAVQRVLHLCRIHQLLRQKYSISVEDIVPHMEKLHVIRAAEIEEFQALLADNHPERTLDFVLLMLHRLHDVILDPRPSQGREDIYYKRHIAAGIPSMYGRYMEPKFQALGLAYRFEALATRLVARIVEETNLRYITAATLRRIHRILALFRRSLEIEGYSDEGFSSSVEMLRYGLSTTSFTIRQYMNVFQFLADNVKSIIFTNFITPHEVQLMHIIPHYLRNEGETADPTTGKHAISERIYRDLISTTFPIQQLDSFVAAVLLSMNDMLRHLTPDVIQGVMGYDSRLVTTRLFQADPELDNPVFLGAKGYYLKRLYELGFPVPPGFIITTELFRRRDAINRHPDMKAEFDELLRKRLGSLERLTGLRYGDPAMPLMLSVRSGAAISIPGAMNTFLNVGLNEEIVEGMSAVDNYGWTSWDCYRRFLQTWGMVQGIPRDDFDAVMVGFKERCGVELKIHFSPAQMREIARTYRRVVLDHGVRLVDDPFRQLTQAVLLVLDSWYTDRARVYRDKLQIAEDWGTAVVVQRMVLGNLNYDSGSGVVFTHDPFVRESGIFLYGDFTVCSQGEDIVAGLVHTLPISERQRLRSQTPVAESLEKDFPGMYRALEEHATAIVQGHNFGHQEIEFTFESSRAEDLYILQTRDHSPTQQQQIAVFDSQAVLEHQVGSGIGIGGGALNGYICFDMDDLAALRREHPDGKLILVRPDTVPDDIGMIFECDGLLTARGGATSHAAVTAVRLHKTCVVDCRDLLVDEDRKTCTINGVSLATGDVLAIDGRMGSIYRGTFPVSYVQIQMP